ncbi:MAG: VCBS repeat-containing protein, partial [Verrucomicrobiota bacterium]|nr:VCBS repeat-containing protein [Verrucomicrobiota bacterium]
MRLSPKILGLGGLLLLVVVGFVLWRGGSQDRPPVSADSGPGDTSVANQEGLTTVATGSDDWKGLDDPGKDGWDTEVLHELLKKKLERLARVIASGEGIEDQARELVDTEIGASELTLSDLEPVWSAGGVSVRRGNPPAGVSYRGLEGFASAVQMISKSLGGNAGTRRCVFKVIALEPGQLGIRARVSVECARIDPDGVVEQHAEWMTDWKAAATGDDLKLVKVVLERFEQSEGRKRIFSDCTESVLGSNDSYRQQILRGYPYWLERIQDTRQMTLLGTPGAALGDVDGDGLEDLYLCQAGGVPNRLYLQKLDGTLQDFTEESGAGWLESSRSALLVDLD